MLIFVFFFGLEKIREMTSENQIFFHLNLIKK